MTIQALVCRNPGDLAIEQREAPVAATGEALVRVRRIGICGTDYHIYEGKHPFLQYPRIMGHELAVEIVEAPAGSRFAPGEAAIVNPYLSCGTCVACRKGKPNCCTKIAVLGVHRDGGMTEYLSLPVGNLLPADGLTLDQCATVEFLAIGAHAVRRGSVVAGDRALVIGAGPIGLGAALFAKLAGASVHLLDRDVSRLDAIGSIVGAAGTIPADANVDAAIAAATDSEGFDIVFDATGATPSMQKAFDFVTSGGRLVLVGVVKDPITFSDSDLHRREMSLFASRNATMDDFATVTAAIRGGHVPVEKIITHRSSLADATTKLPLWAHDKASLIKAVISSD
jgi:2-desacetyl-2-hydroxyethyl bacteriochlorophyllide A dehydrogenase